MIQNKYPSPSQLLLSCVFSLTGLWLQSHSPRRVGGGPGFVSLSWAEGPLQQLFLLLSVMVVWELRLSNICIITAGQLSAGRQL